MIPKRFAEFARKFFELAKKDLKRAEKALEEKDFADSVFHSQQAIEKAVKAMLETKLFYIAEHNVLPYFVKEFQNEWKKEFEIIVDALDMLQGEWNLTRYPRIINEKIVLPDEIYDYEFAKSALEKVRKALEIIEKYLKEKNVL